MCSSHTHRPSLCGVGVNAIAVNAMSQAVSGRSGHGDPTVGTSCSRSRNKHMHYRFLQFPPTVPPPPPCLSHHPHTHTYCLPSSCTHTMFWQKDATRKPGNTNLVRWDTAAGRGAAPRTVGAGRAGFAAARRGRLGATRARGGSGGLKLGATKSSATVNKLTEDNFEW